MEARQWLNSTLVDLVQFDANGAVVPESVIPFIDGGTEGFGGQARVFLPRLTSCFECSLPSMPPATGFPSCTIRNVPRLPEHCIVYALKVEWPLLLSFRSPSDFELYERKDAGDDFLPSAVSLDKDDARHMTWLYERAKARAAQFGIGGVSYALTMQVVKSIIPAIASTNALIAAACVNECWKLRTNAALRLDNYFMYLGATSTGTNTETLQYRQNPQCAVCRPPHVARGVEVESVTLGQLMHRLTGELALDRPSVSTDEGAMLYLPLLHAQHKDNLERTLGQLGVLAGHMLRVNDKGGNSLKVLLL